MLDHLGTMATFGSGEHTAHAAAQSDNEEYSRGEHRPVAAPATQKGTLLAGGNPKLSSISCILVVAILVQLADCRYYDLNNVSASLSLYLYLSLSLSLYFPLPSLARRT